MKLTFDLHIHSMHSALLLLREADEKQQDLKPVIASFACCHQACISSGDLDGFYWSLQLLQGILSRSSFKDPTSTGEDLATHLLGCFTAEGAVGVESPEALADFHVASLKAEEKWFVDCFAAAKTFYLRYEAAKGVGALLQTTEGKLEEALRWFAIARNCARNLTADSLAIASYLMAKSLVMLGRIDEAVAVLDEAAGQGKFFLALEVMLEADIQAQRPGSAVQKVVAAYTKARVTLVPLMSDLEQKLTEYLGGTSCCSCLLLLKYLKLDQFTRYFINTSSMFSGKETEPPQQVERCFFIYQHYSDSRKLLGRLQEQQLPRIESYMDPRPHLEQAMDVLYSKNSVPALEHLVLCQQIAVKAGHTSCFAAVAVFIDQYISWDENSEEMLARFVACFKAIGQDEEDPEAWALYHVGRSRADNGKIPEEYQQLLKQALAKLKTPLLGYYVTHALGSYSEELEMKLHYFHLTRTYSRSTGREDLLVESYYVSFEALFQERLFEGLNGIHEELLELCSSLLDPRFGQGIAKFMEGMLLTNLRDIRGIEALQEAINLLGSLPRFSQIEWLSHYLQSDGDTWSMVHNTSAQLAYGNASNMLRSSDRGRTLYYSVSDEYDEIQLKKGRLDSLLKSLKSLIAEGNLKGAEQQAADLLQVIEQYSADIGPVAGVYRVHLWLQLSEIAFCYCQLAETEEPKPEQLMSTVDMINGFMEEATTMAEETAKVLPFRAIIASIPFAHGSILWKLGQKETAIQILEQVPLLACTQMDKNFGTFSTGRIINLENAKGFFRLLQSLLWPDNLPRALVWTERERARDLLYTMRRQGDRESYLKALAEFDEDHDKAFAEVRSISEMLGKDTVILVVQQQKQPDSLYTYFLHPDAEIAGSRCESFAPVAQVLAAIQNGNDGAAREHLAAYHDILIGPFSEQLQLLQPRRLLFVPNEDMCMFPFAALFDPSRSEKKYLIERYAISMVPSLRLLKHCVLRSRELAVQEEEQELSALVIGNPTSGLPHSDQEAELVETVLKQAGFSSVTKLGEGEATKQTVLDKLPSCSWVHIASHYVVNEEFPDGALLLSGPGKARGKAIVKLELCRKLRDELISGGDSFTGRDLQSLLKASAVVLSACSSGLGRVFAEGVQALPRWFHIAGVPSAVISLWNVDDEFTKMLMKEIYKNLLQGQQLADAVQLAMVQMLEVDELGGQCSLSLWAPFIISGDPTVMLPQISFSNLADPICTFER